MNQALYDPDRSTRSTRKSFRLPTHNYSWTGTYFITLHAPGKEPIFDHPILQTILKETWEILPTKCSSLAPDAFSHYRFHLRLREWVAVRRVAPGSCRE